MIRTTPTPYEKSLLGRKAKTPQPERVWPDPLLTHKQRKPDVVSLSLQNPEAVRAELCRRSFYFFVQEFWETLINEQPVWNWHIKFVCDELQVMMERVMRRLPKLYDFFLNIPPGTTKSTIMTQMLPAWCWIARFPKKGVAGAVDGWWMSFIVGSYSSTLSMEHGQKCLDIVSSEKYKRYFPDTRVREEKEARSNFQMEKMGLDGRWTHGGTRFSTSVGGTATGMHAHVLIADDPINPKEAASPVRLGIANRWMTQTLPTRKIDKAVCPFILVMQRLHEDDPTGHLLEKHRGKGIRHICLPAEIDDRAAPLPGEKDMRIRPKPDEMASFYRDGLLDPVRMPRVVLDGFLATLGQYGYASQFLQTPTKPEGGMFQVDKFRVIETMPPDIPVASIVRYWDKAGTGDGDNDKKRKQSAWTVGCKMAVLKNGHYVIMDIVRGKWSSEDREREMRRVAEMDGRHTIQWMEQEPGSGGKESAQGSIRNLAGYIAKAETVTGDKVSRADPYAVQVNWGNVYLLRAPWNKDYIDEHRFFPYSRFKDQVDASSGAFNKLATRKKVSVL